MALVAKTKTQKAADLAAVTQPEVTSQNPAPYTLAEENHRFTHVPPAGYVERSFPVAQ